jgi:hypothetical protein
METLEPGANLNGSFGNGGNWATVQPQLVWSRVMETSAEETFVTKKVNGAELSPGLASYFFWIASQRRALAVAGAGAIWLLLLQLGQHL